MEKCPRAAMRESGFHVAPISSSLAIEHKSLLLVNPIAAKQKESRTFSFGHIKVNFRWLSFHCRHHCIPTLHPRQVLFTSYYPHAWSGHSITILIHRIYHCQNFDSISRRIVKQKVIVLLSLSLKSLTSDLDPIVRHMSLLFLSCSLYSHNAIVLLLPPICLAT